MELTLGFIIGMSLILLTPIGGIIMSIINPSFILDIFKKHGLPDNIKADEVAHDIKEEIKSHCKPVYKREGDEYFDEHEHKYKSYDEIAWIFDREQIEKDSYELLLKKVIEIYKRPVGEFVGAFDTREDRARAFEEIMHRSEKFVQKQQNKDEDIL